MEQEKQQDVLTSLETVEAILDEVIQRGAEIMYLKYVDSKLDGYSLDNALNAISYTMEGGFIEHDAGELLAALDETPSRLKKQGDDGMGGYPRLETLKEQQHSFMEDDGMESVSREEIGLAQAKGGEFDRGQHEWGVLKEPVGRGGDSQEPAKIDSLARMALKSEKVSTLKKTDSLIGKVRTKRPTYSQASSHKGAAAAQKQTRESVAVPSTLRINPIRIEQDELIEEDEKVQRLREWKLAQLREQEEENKRREEREATERKNIEKQRKLLELMKRQTITYDSKGGVLGVRKVPSIHLSNKLKGLDYEVERKTGKNSGRRETEEEISSARPDKTRGSITQSEDDPFVCDKRHFAGSNFGMLQPNYGVQIKENEKVKTGSYAFKEHFQVMSRAEYEAECVPQLMGKEFINTLAQQTSNLHLTQMGIKERGAGGMPNEYSTIKEERGETTKLMEGSIQIQDVDVNNLKVDLPPPNFALSSDKYSTLPCGEINRKKRGKSTAKAEYIKDEQYQTVREESQLPNFMRSTVSTKGIGKSPRLEAFDSVHSSKAGKTFKIKLMSSNETLQVKKPQKHESEFTKLLKQASEPNLGRTTMFFESEKKIKNRQLLVHQKSLSRDRSQPSLVARTLKTGKAGKIKKAVFLPPLPPPPIGRTLGHGVINDISRISQI